MEIAEGDRAEAWRDVLADDAAVVVEGDLVNVERGPPARQPFVHGDTSPCAVVKGVATLIDIDLPCPVPGRPLAGEAAFRGHGTILTAVPHSPMPTTGALYPRHHKPPASREPSARDAGLGAPQVEQPGSPAPRRPAPSVCTSPGAESAQYTNALDGHNSLRWANGTRIASVPT